MLTYNGSGFQTNSVQFDWIGGWNLSGGDQQFVGDFNGDGKDDVFIRSAEYAGLLTYNGSGFQTNSVQFDWIDGWNLSGGDQQFVGDFNGDGKDDVFIRSAEYAGLLTYNGSGFQTNSVQFDWIGGWNLSGGDQHFVGDFNGDGKDDVFIRSAEYAGMLTYNGSGFQTNSVQFDWIGGWNLGGGDQHFVGDFN
ncbi:FG-GAP repeat domain-containing protein [Nostoc sphaeroides]|uniref:FG-GAP repeat domain-containing protein n=1 Tax=Nostoc sphaeroides TaxID=446679 RepID=UPI001C70799B|nr:VCBS repeat-containing protein [Nostoc sphaeroides]